MLPVDELDTAYKFIKHDLLYVDITNIVHVMIFRVYLGRHSFGS